MFEIIAQTAPQAAEAAGWDQSLLLATFLVGLGLVLILAEVFFVSFGLLTLCSLASLTSGIIIAFNIGTGTGITFIVLVVVLMPIMIAVGVKMMPRTHWGRRLIPGGPTLEEVTASGADRELEALLGKTGKTLSMCRPAGTAEIDGRRCDVISESLTVPPGRPVEVIEVEGNRIVVRELQDDAEEKK